MTARQHQSNDSDSVSTAGLPLYCSGGAWEERCRSVWGRELGHQQREH